MPIVSLTSGEVGEGAVGVSHLVRVFAFLDGGAAAVHGVGQFARETFFHRVFVALGGGGDQPALADAGGAVARVPAEPARVDAQRQAARGGRRRRRAGSVGTDWVTTEA